MYYKLKINSKSLTVTATSGPVLVKLDLVFKRGIVIVSREELRTITGQLTKLMRLSPPLAVVFCWNEFLLNLVLRILWRGHPRLNHLFKYFMLLHLVGFSLHLKELHLPFVLRVEIIRVDNVVELLCFRFEMLVVQFVAVFKERVKV
jgi:hypothetical protein